MKVIGIEKLPGTRTAYDLTVDNTHAYFVGPGVLAHNCSIRCENGQITQCLTRGDGIEGEDITRNVLLMNGVKGIPGFTGFLRGEIVLLKSKLAAHFPGGSNCRNVAAGTAKRQSDPSKCKHLDVFFYQAIPDDGPLPTKRAELALLRMAGLQTGDFRFYSPATASDVEALYVEMQGGARDALDWDIDGLVIEINDPQRVLDLGDGNGDGRPKGAIALKFPHDQKETTLRDVIWQVGKSGRLTPVAIFDSINLNGVNVERASLHNIDNFDALKLSVGCRVLVSRRNDCIPYLEANLDI